MRWFLAALLILFLLATATAASSPGDRRVWVIGGAHSNVYHPAACDRVRKHRQYAEKMWESDAKDLGLRNHGCGSH